MDARARVIRLVSAPGPSEESAMADGGESGCAGAGGVEKGRLLAALRRGEAVVFADEMRLGLLRQVRRMWGRRGEKQRRRMELQYAWVYWVLDVDAMRERLWWDWVKRVRGVEIAQVLRSWKGTGVKGVIWDLAAFHKEKAVEEVLQRLEAERKVSSLVGWRYIRQALNALPS
jgi:hypothetical protein